MFKTLIVTVAYMPAQNIVKNLTVNYFPHLVVDNSEQESLWLKEFCEMHGHHYQWLGRNLGIAKALNIGAEYALDHGYEYIVTMDQDSELTNQMLSSISDYIVKLNNPEVVAVCSPRHVHDGIEVAERDDVTNDFYSMSSGNFINLQIWKRLGGFDEKLFIDMVDVDYYVKSLINDYQVLTLQSVTMLHRMGERVQSRRFLMYTFDVWNHSKERKYYQARNFYYIYSKYNREIPELLYFKKIIFKMIFSIIFFENNKFSKLYYYLRGYIDYRRGKFGKIYF